MNFRLALALLFVASLIAAKIPIDGQEAHHQADTVFWPAFVSAANDWVNNHPRTQEHYAKFDKPDAEKLNLVRKRFHDWDEAMKRAGY